MPFARDDHVIIAIIPHFAGAPCLTRGHGTGHGQCVALAFLAAKATPHTPTLHPHPMHGQAQSIGHFVLYLSRVLGRAMDHHIPALLWQGQGGLTFEIEMLLPAHGDFTLQAAL